MPPRKRARHFGSPGCRFRSLNVGTARCGFPSSQRVVSAKPSERAALVGHRATGAEMGTPPASSVAWSRSRRASSSVPRRRREGDQDSHDPDVLPFDATTVRSLVATGRGRQPGGGREAQLAGERAAAASPHTCRTIDDLNAGHSPGNPSGAPQFPSSYRATRRGPPRRLDERRGGPGSERSLWSQRAQSSV